MITPMLLDNSVAVRPAYSWLVGFLDSGSTHFS